MKLIFLDIDGVLNSSHNDICTIDGKLLNSKCIESLNKLVSHTGAEIIISSTWRKVYSQTALNTVLTDAGCRFYLRGMTGNSSHGYRGLEIQQVCNALQPDNYIILDDDSDMLLRQAPHFFLTDCDYGLTDKLAAKAIKFLNGQLF